MKILICYHSTTGNTKTVTLYTRTLFQSLGHQCEVVDITRAPSSELSMEDWDLVGFASPTLYFRGTFTMERFITNLPPVSGPARPAFLLATCAGEPGAQFHLQAETLHHKGYVVTGAHAVIAPSNWPMQLALTDKITWSEPLGRTITRIFRPSRLLLSALWPALGTPDQKDKSSLDRFVESLASQSIDTP
ncbi:hypothetical protein KJ865_14795, partial [Myxococcota bacterium]|nr:hypothetical protein [Myxococcota bacterium]